MKCYEMFYKFYNMSTLSLILCPLQVRKLRIELEDEKSRVATSERRRHVAAAPAENGPDLHEMLDTQSKIVTGLIALMYICICM